MKKLFMMAAAVVALNTADAQTTLPSDKNLIPVVSANGEKTIYHKEYEKEILELLKRDEEERNAIKENNVEGSSELFDFIKNGNRHNSSSGNRRNNHAPNPSNPDNNRNGGDGNPDLDDIEDENEGIVRQEYMRMKAQVVPLLIKNQNEVLEMKKLSTEKEIWEGKIDLKYDRNGKFLGGIFKKNKSGDSEIGDMSVKEVKNQIDLIEQSILGQETDIIDRHNEISIILKHYAQDRDVDLPKIEAVKSVDRKSLDELVLFYEDVVDTVEGLGDDIKNAK